ncbi:MAG: hypothetical protein ABF780_03865 [Bifidobacterium aquikefiri]|uniref:ABC transporter ATPase n=1 Tax=Bifidobacterium aquikefiri TaxID=1653207 RepID=A0A261G115_9BIFI|nr:hypothetical protein [Bifidobacterium aquikefiri]OZG65107.1 ABC transporter ATPase [Bifidobacterium aquikefiri]
MKRHIQSAWNTYRAMAVIDKSILAATVSVASGIGMALVKLALGIMTNSMLFIVNAAYYVVLCVSRFIIVRKHQSLRRVDDVLSRLASEMTVYHRTGLLLGVIGVSYAAFSAIMFMNDKAKSYNQIIAITVATITVTKIGIAVRGLVVSRRERNPMDSAIKLISFTDALLSVVVMQNVLLESTQSQHANQSSGLFGMALGLGVIIAGGIMFAQKDAGNAFRQKALEEISSSKK